MTYKTGTIGDFMKWTKRVVANPDAAKDAPKRWFDSDATAARAQGAATSPEAMVKLLSEENLRLLRLIVSEKPKSLHELATLSHRKESNLSRTLRKLHEAGIVDFEEGPGRTRAPRVTAQRVTLDLDLVGPGSVVSVERRPTAG
jgi:predicted transcriptional regulator